VPPKDWVQFRDSCYQFFPDRLGQASGVARECRDLEARAYGVGIETLEEDTFLQAYSSSAALESACKCYPLWSRVVNSPSLFGARPRDQIWVGDPQTPFNFTNWWPGYTRQTYYPTLILVWHNASLTYKWKGEWAYSAYQWPGGAYPYICERKAQ
ncbi:hypothetical protein BaRGS_00038369, partial [Batillaria attramentaria]